jgi:hypothetical protein
VTEETRTPAQGDRRLASISHHFLSDEPALPHAAGRQRPIVITLAGQRDHPLPALALAEALVHHGICCDIHEPGRTAIRLQPQAEMTTAQQAWPSAVYLAVSDTPDSGIIAGTDTLLLAVPASAVGLRNGFARLKRYLNVMQPSRVGVTLLDCDDADQAGCYFGQLRQACRRFLALELSSYGAINTAGGPADISGIARLLADDLGLMATGPAAAEHESREETP